MANENLYDKLRVKIRDNAFHCFGYQYIYNNRIKKFDFYLGAIKTMGIIVPSLIGALALAYGIDNSFLKWIMPFAIVATVIQFILSVFAVTGKWDDKLSYSHEASQSYNSLYRRFLEAADYPPPSFDELKPKYDTLESEYNSRNQQDVKQNITEKEERKGMRYALRQFQWKCASCNIIPYSMDPTKCPVCGNF